MAAQLIATNGPSARGTQGVQRAREQFLAGSALPFQQDGGVRRRGAMELLRHLPELRVLADDARCAPPLGQLLLQEEIIGQHPPLRDRAFDHQQQVIRIDRLGQEVHRALAHRGHRVLDAAVGGHDDDLAARDRAPSRREERRSHHRGQLQVGEDDRRTRLP